MAMDVLDPIDDWLSAIDAIRLLSSKMSGHEQAKADLLSRMQDGLVESRAQYICQEADVGDIALDNLDWDDYRQAKSKPPVFRSTPDALSQKLFQALRLPWSGTAFGD